MAATPSSKGPVVDMNVTPMLDVLLVLFVTLFLLNLKPPKPHINVQVPAPAEGGPGRGAQLVLQLPDAGGFVLNGQPVPDDQFEEIIRSAFDGRPVKLLYVGAGGERRYEEVIRAVDRAKGAGVQVVAYLP
ncbi:MAG TPA: biopolymer transporter ExbD [Gemmatimonadales bacterium]|nr:biopolymer transporter ExbD [Gemmatimonadales bacterium]